MSLTPKQRYKEKFVFNAQANRAYLSILDDTETLQELAHISIAHHYWLQRLINRSPTLQLGSILEKKQLAKLDEQNLSSTLSALSVLALDKIISYQNVQGAPFKNSFEEILDHILFHSQYHRGQLSVSMKEHYSSVPNTDLITFYRST